jgi:DNA-binding transcriptional regulator YiaG
VQAHVLDHNGPFGYHTFEEDSVMTTHAKAARSGHPSTGRRAGKAKQGGAGALRARLGMTIKLFSRLTGFSERAIAKWESGESISVPAQRRLLEIARFQERLAEVVKLESIPRWLETPNDAFAGLKPLEVIERGEIDRLWNMIFYLESGVAS